MKRFPYFVILLLTDFPSSIRCILGQAPYEDWDLYTDDSEPTLIFDDSLLELQPTLEIDPNWILAGASDQCSNHFDIFPSGKIRARESVCPSGEVVSPALDAILPTLDDSSDTSYLCPFSLEGSPLVLVCGNPKTPAGFVPSPTTVYDAEICKFVYMSSRFVYGH
jgi:hypothetical protein